MDAGPGHPVTLAPFVLTPADITATIAASVERPVSVPVAECWPITVPGRRWVGHQWLVLWAIHVSPGAIVLASVPAGNS